MQQSDTRNTTTDVATYVLGIDTGVGANSCGVCVTEVETQRPVFYTLLDVPSAGVDGVVKSIVEIAAKYAIVDVVIEDFVYMCFKQPGKRAFRTPAKTLKAMNFFLGNVVGALRILGYEVHVVTPKKWKAGLRKQLITDGLVAKSEAKVNTSLILRRWLAENEGIIFKTEKIWKAEGHWVDAYGMTLYVLKCM